MNEQVVHTNDENQGAMLTRNAAKRAPENQAQKRTALGEITSLAVRQQPARAAKSNMPFKIYEDKENSSAQPDQSRPKAKKAQSQPPVKPALRQQQQLPPTKPVQAACESPMVLDVSVMDTEESVAPSTQTIETSAGEDRDFLLYCLPEYQTDIHDYLREAELRFRPKPYYMRKQVDISPQMRTILVDWLVEVGEEYKLHDETLHLAVNYIDRFLSQMSVLRGKLQLVGTACMFLASKYEEIYPPDVGEFVYITDDTYTKKQLLKMEHLVIKILGFDIAVPTSNAFLEMYCRLLGVEDTLKCLTQYIVELSLLDCDKYLIERPSKIASAALFLASNILTKNYHPPSMSQIEEVTRYKQSDVASCAQKLLSTLKAAPEHPQQAVREKYKADSKRAVSTLPIPEFC